MLYHRYDKRSCIRVYHLCQNTLANLVCEESLVIGPRSCFVRQSCRRPHLPKQLSQILSVRMVPKNVSLLVEEADLLRI